MTRRLKSPTSAVTDDMAIGLVAQLSGIRASALRYYESEGLIEPARRVNGRRRYDRGVLDRLAIIGMAQSVGFTIAEVKTLLAGIDADRLSKSWKKHMSAKLDQLDDDIRRMRTMQRMLRAAIDCGCADVVTCARVAR
jgi:MerR family redox-sensitive transcriptional activator SoxR